MKHIRQKTTTGKTVYSLVAEDKEDLKVILEMEKEGLVDTWAGFSEFPEWSREQDRLQRIRETEPVENAIARYRRHVCQGLSKDRNLREEALMAQKTRDLISRRWVELSPDQMRDVDDIDKELEIRKKQILPSPGAHVDNTGDWWNALILD